MRVMLGKFACFSIEARFGADLASGVQAALRHYTRRLKSAKEPVAIPAFCRNQALDGSGAEFELAVEPAIQATLEREARRQAVRIDQLLVHAIFVYLADMDSSSRIGLEAWARP